MAANRHPILKAVLDRHDEENDTLVADVSAMADKHGRTARVIGIWLHVQDPDHPSIGQGWKLHVAARPSTLRDTVDAALPILLARHCGFKIARSVAVLAELNSSLSAPSAIGKAITIYPPADQVVEIATELADALAGFAAPRINSDRRVRPDAPVYYRYGPYTPRYRCRENGDFDLVVIGPEGEIFPGAADWEYRCPPWARDPFQPDRPAAAPDPVPGTSREVTLGGRYTLTGGLTHQARGNVYRAIDTMTGESVVVKEARAYVSENRDGIDLRHHLRNERRVLTALADVPHRLPRFLDHFRHGEDEYLVITDLGELNLVDDVRDNGQYRPAGPPGRDLDTLAADLVELLDAVHAAGVVVRDLAPKNVMIGDDGRLGLIDFDNSAYEGFQRYGWTLGYAPPEQRVNAPARVEDDYFALGATLYFAATGLEPVRTDDDLYHNAERTCMALATIRRDMPGVLSLVPSLLSRDVRRRTAAVELIRSNQHRGPRLTWAGLARVPAPPTLDADRLARIVDVTVAECVGFAEAMIEATDQPRRTSASLGSAGLGLELLHHDDPAARKAAAELARWTAEAIPPCEQPPGLTFGRTGTRVFLAAASATLADEDLSREIGRVLTPVELSGDELDEFILGLAGIGVGHLIIDSVTGDPGFRAVAETCARRIIDGEIGERADPHPEPEPGAGVDVSAGFGHGRAGVAYFLLAYWQATGDREVERVARERFDSLTKEMPWMLNDVAAGAAWPMAGSWCQGLGGIGTALLRAGRAWEDERYLALAQDAARACLAVAPGMPVVSQCCGMAAAGEYLIDVALATGNDEYFAAAERVAALMLTRIAGSDDEPLFPDHSLASSSGEWGSGSAGVLTFLRRLRDRGGYRFWLADWRPPVWTAAR